MGRFLIKEEVEALRRSGQILGEVLKKIRSLIVPGVRASSIDQVAEKEIRRLGARPAFLGYRGYPASVCVSLNDEVVHGIPRDQVVKEGDLVSIDLGVEFDGFYTDAAFSVVVGNGNALARRLVEVTREALYAGIKKAIPGNRIGDISHAIQMVAERNGFSVVRDLVGHGIGRALHEEPQVPNFGKKGQGTLLEKGMVLAIEPMVNEKGYRVKVLKDGWTIVTEDGGLSAHFEHTILVTDGAPEILTSWERG
ncbi:MAG: type I methionyl aminopeptidase [Candidatus Atribacteria bacterium]|nr:type I methionyl aminopeptidase [Candidatus Atribacteria bacterium]